MKKILNNNVFYMIAIIVVSNITSFLLGGLLIYFLSKPAKNSQPIALTPIPTDTAQVQKNHVYASIRGKRYYPWWCDKGNLIAKENIIWFNTPQAAKKEGYTIAKGCQ